MSKLRYDNGQDWVEVAPGVSRLPMRALVMLDGDKLTAAHAFAVQHTAEAHFLDADGQVVDWRTDILGLTVQQWSWWKARIWQGARDEIISPEA